MQRVANPDHVSPAELEAGLDTILAAPRDHGVLELIVRRPDVESREVVDEAELDLETASSNT